MSKIRLGYGSEWHMLRMLGRHRAWFTQHVLSAVGGSDLTWKDFNFTGTVGEAVLSKNSNGAKAEWLRASLLQRWV